MSEIIPILINRRPVEPSKWLISLKPAKSAPGRYKVSKGDFILDAPVKTTRLSFFGNLKYHIKRKLRRK